MSDTRDDDAVDEVLGGPLDASKAEADVRVRSEAHVNYFVQLLASLTAAHIAFLGVYALSGPLEDHLASEKGPLAWFGVVPAVCAVVGVVVGVVVAGNAFPRIPGGKMSRRSQVRSLVVSSVALVAAVVFAIAALGLAAIEAPPPTPDSGSVETGSRPG